jgi:hypothetical protein
MQFAAGPFAPVCLTVYETLKQAAASLTAWPGRLPG